MTLLPCRVCGRHVKSVEHACPFCGAARSCDEQPVQVQPTGRRLKAIAVTAALGLSACGSSSSSGGDAGVAQPAYGVVQVPEDAGKDAPDDGPPVGQPLYGTVAPPVDGSTG